MKIVQNKVVKLLPIEHGHVEGIFKVSQHAEIWEHLTATLLDKESVESYVSDMVKKREAKTDFPYVIVDAKTDKIIGSTTLLEISHEHKRAEIGSTWLTPSYWRTTMNTNCKFLLLKYAFEELDLHRVQIKTGHENIRSQKAIERLGATKEGILRNHMIRKEGIQRHTVMYSIIKEEWPELKQRFIAQLL